MAAAGPVPVPAAPLLPPGQHRAAAAAERQRPGRPSPGQGEPLAAEPDRLRRCSWSPPLAGAFPGAGDRRTPRADTRFAASRAAAETGPARRCAPPAWPCCRGQRSSDPPRRRKAARPPYCQQHGVPSRAGRRTDDFGKRHRAALAVLSPHRAEGSVFSLRLCSLAVTGGPRLRIPSDRSDTRHSDTVRGSSRALLVERGLY